MSLADIRNENKRQDSFAHSKIDTGDLSTEEVKEIKEEVFYKIVKPVNCNTFNELAKRDKK